ncbi:NAD-dependent epimerase/dehydratase family protein [Limnohabitans sp. JirII-31]|uniref:NAD-dependent epimerase/dehydratase family protein n=1 Tax=Limnohabitans sp. JirII-31 TaxID=1977908 RepID=UPI000C1E260D|nr:NAD-dependent epimerase/dehydratase family protein [Limnohabitans sp. JirII-31]PIT74711.1 GDP-mannose 4,6 dehydratase [Limnohabitans sp. JirII-31]
MKILLTGADGFTGRHFADLARAHGHDVVPLLSDLRDSQELEREVLATMPDSVVHLAAISFVAHADDSAFYAVNVVGSINLLAALVKLPVTPQRVLLASSANVYGNCSESPVLESQFPAPVNHYSMSKLAMEFMSRAYTDRLPIITTRPFNYTGPGQAVNFLIPKLVHHFARRAPSILLGNLHVEREFNDVQMVCCAYLHLLQHGEAGEVYNVGTGRPHTLQYVIDELVRITGHQINVEVSSAFVRANEVQRLFGDINKLRSLFLRHAKTLPEINLEDTLRRMLLAESSC